jgi:hypothetical protein
MITRLVKNIFFSYFVLKILIFENPNYNPIEFIIFNFAKYTNFDYGIDVLVFASPDLHFPVINRIV